MAKRDQRASARPTRGTRPRGDQPSEHEIALAAYRKYEERGCIHGFDREDWLSAETELKQRQRTSTNG